MTLPEIVRLLRRDADATDSGPAAILWREAANEIESLRKLLRQIACQTDPAWARQMARDEVGIADDEPPVPRALIGGFCWSCGATPRYQHKADCRASKLRSVPRGA